MGKGKRNRERRGPDAHGVEETFFEAFVNAPDGRPFVQMTCQLDGVPVFAVKMSPAVATALGLRAVQTAIEAERDAGLIAFLRSCEAPDEMEGSLLSGLREHRQRFDAAAGTMASLADNDPSSLTNEPPDRDE